MWSGVELEGKGEDEEEVNEVEPKCSRAFTNEKNSLTGKHNTFSF